MSSELEEAVAQDQRLKNILEFTNSLRQEVTSFSRHPSHSHSSSTLPSIPTPPPPVFPNPPMALVRNQTLKELAAPTLDQLPLCINMPQLEAAFEPKSGMMHLLPTFNGLAREDPNKHLKEFHVVCSSMKPIGIFVEKVKLRAFPFSLADKAKEWLYYLLSGTITTWNEMNKVFLEKHFSSSKATSI